MPALAVHDVRFDYGETRALDGISLAVEPGERVALLGRNGSGKTTLLKLASTLLVPGSGTVEVCGYDAVRQPGAARQRIGTVFQHVALDDALTARESLVLQAALVGIPRSERARRLDDALREAGLRDRANQRVGALSGGLARRLDLARGLLHRPALALLDEPTTGLDPIARDDFWSVLDRRRDDGALVISTHLLDEAERCDRVVIVAAGRVVADGAPATLTRALGTDALWLEGPSPSELADALGPEARVVGDRVLLSVDDAETRVAELYARDDVEAVSIRPPSLADVFEAAVADAPPTP